MKKQSKMFSAREKRLGKRNRPVLSFLFGKNRTSPIRYENELTLYVGKHELFDRHVLLPHAELNATVYEAVNQFTERYRGEGMTLNIICDSVSESLQETFREVYLSHYEDEYRNVTMYLYRRYRRVVLLIIISVIAYYVGSFWTSQLEQSNFLLDVITNIGVFCIWEIGYTHFDRVDAAGERKRIIRARDAEIIFHKTGKRKTEDDPMG